MGRKPRLLSRTRPTHEYIPTVLKTTQRTQGYEIEAGDQLRISFVNRVDDVSMACVTVPQRTVRCDADWSVDQDVVRKTIAQSGSHDLQRVLLIVFPRRSGYDPSV
jgi:hypothetical protein